MQRHFGPVRAASVARDHVFSALGGHSIDEALDGGADPKQVWFAVCDTFEVPAEMRYGLPDDPEPAKAR